MRHFGELNNTTRHMQREKMMFLTNMFRDKRCQRRWQCHKFNRGWNNDLEIVLHEWRRWTPNDVSRWHNEMRYETKGANDTSRNLFDTLLLFGVCVRWCGVYGRQYMDLIRCALNLWNHAHIFVENGGGSAQILDYQHFFSSSIFIIIYHL